MGDQEKKYDPTKDKAKGKMEQVEGKAREEVGKLGGDTSTQVGGMVEQGRGKVREGVADARHEWEKKDWEKKDEAKEPPKP